MSPLPDMETLACVLVEGGLKVACPGSKGCLDTRVCCGAGRLGRTSFPAPPAQLGSPRSFPQWPLGESLPGEGPHCLPRGGFLLPAASQRAAHVPKELEGRTAPPESTLPNTLHQQLHLGLHAGGRDPSTWGFLLPPEVHINGNWMGSGYEAITKHLLCGRRFPRQRSGHSASLGTHVSMALSAASHALLPALRSTASSPLLAGPGVGTRRK